jgi:hypothetical protein
MRPLVNKTFGSWVTEKHEKFMNERVNISSNNRQLNLNSSKTSPSNSLDTTSGTRPRVAVALSGD